MYYLAIDIGASSGRHILGWVEQGKIKTEEVYRFENNAGLTNNLLCWNTKALFHHILTGLKQCKIIGKIPVTVAIDTWAVDYVLLGQKGEILSEAVCYRDNRTEPFVTTVEEKISFENLYRRTGIQKQVFNTVYQLMAEKETRPQVFAQAEHLLMIPEYFNYLLTGEIKNEYTNASTTALVHAADKNWDWALIDLLGYPAKLFGALHQPGSSVGHLLPAIQQEIGFNCSVILAASHDTASAYLSVPAKAENSVYLSSGTWSLLGTEIDTPLVSDAARQANFTNEGGYEYRYRFLKNIMGLWMIQSIRRNLDKKYSFAELEQFAREENDFQGFVDANDGRFLNPKSMIEEIKLACRESGQPVPQNIGQLMQCVYQSLAKTYALTIQELEEITNKVYTVLHIVGGGTKDVYLNQLTADYTGLTVLAGPTEGTVIGNLLCQMIANREFDSLEQARAVVRESFSIQMYQPKEKQ